MKFTKELFRLASGADHQQIAEIAFLEGRREGLLHAAGDKNLPVKAQDGFKALAKDLCQEIKEKANQEAARLLDCHIKSEIEKAGAQVPDVAFQLVKKNLNIKVTEQGDIDTTLAGCHLISPEDIARHVASIKCHPDTALLFGDGKAEERPKGDNPRRYSGPNPWKKETRNLTEQGRIRDENPERARYLIIEAGLDPSTYHL